MTFIIDNNDNFLEEIEIKEKPFIEKEKIIEANILFYKPDKNHIEITKLFLFCKDFLSSVPELKKYITEKYNEFDKLSTFIYYIERGGYCSYKYEEKLQEIVALNRYVMMGFIHQTQKILKLFSENIEEMPETPFKKSSETPLI